MIIGITGASGCGKSTLANKLIDKYHIIHVDEISHKAIMCDEILPKIKEEFGVDLKIQSRKELGEIVFSDKNKYNKLDKIVYPKIREMLLKEINENNNIVIDHALLPNTEFFDLCDIKILIESAYDKRLENIKKRDKISNEYIENRNKNGIIYNNNDYDYVIHNHYNDNSFNKIIEILNGDVE